MDAQWPLMILLNGLLGWWLFSRDTMKRSYLTFGFMALFFFSQMLFLYGVHSRNAGVLFTSEAVGFSVLPPLCLILLKRSWLQKALWQHTIRRISTFLLTPLLAVGIYSIGIRVFHHQLLTSSPWEGFWAILAYWSFFSVSILCWLPLIVVVKPLIGWSYMKRILFLCLYPFIRIGSFFTSEPSPHASFHDIGIIFYYSTDILVTCIVLFSIIHQASKAEDTIDDVPLKWT